jgi:8-oxo-dGTP diphosphatase
LITTGEAARELGVSRETLNAWVRDGKVTPHSRTVGKHMRWDLEQLRRQIRDVQEVSIVTSDPSKPEEQPVVAAVLTSERGMLVTWRNDKEPPAGFLTGEIEPGESPLDAMVRECKEEAGLLVVASHVIGRRIHPRSNRTMIYVAGQPAPGKADVFVGDAEELADVRWISLEEAVEAFEPFGGMYAPVHDWLQRALDRS